MVTLRDRSKLSHRHCVPKSFALFPAYTRQGRRPTLGVYHLICENPQYPVFFYEDIAPVLYRESYTPFLLRIGDTSAQS
jgi:hypothetical protein